MHKNMHKNTLVFSGLFTVAVANHVLMFKGFFAGGEPLNSLQGK